jgi:uncharacterized protein (DUF305 family)
VSVVKILQSRTAGLVLTALTCGACNGGAGASMTRVVAAPERRPPIVQPGAPGQPARELSAVEASDLSRVQFTSDDVKFMQGMIGHHQQAIEMTALLASHTESEDMRRLGHRIELSQVDEIKMMERWLEVRSQPLPDPGGHTHGAATLMPGMLTPGDMERLAAAKGAAFDRMFLEGMIKHHGGALQMVEELFAREGAAQDSEVFAFASDVDGDQRMEIARMGAMLEERMR